MSNLDAIYEAKFFKKLLVLVKNAIIINEKNIESKSTHGIYKHHKHAIKSYINRDFLSTIFFCSIGVEAFLNKHIKLGEYKKKRSYNWITLNTESLLKGKEVGLPTIELLDRSEIPDFNDANKKLPIFCVRRNKILHGDTSGLISKTHDRNLPEITVFDSKKYTNESGFFYIYDEGEAAFDQLLKFQKFIIKI